MAQLIAPEPGVELNVAAINAIVNSMERGKDTRLELVKNEGIDIENDEWVDFQKGLDVYKSILDNLGEMNLFLIGKAITENAVFPPMKDLEEALGSIDAAYHLNHRKNGEIMFDTKTGKMLEGIGHYNLTYFDAEKREATMICDNPYPSKFDEGIIVQIVRKFKPTPKAEKVELDATKETRKEGGKTCTYNIRW